MSATMITTLYAITSLHRDLDIVSVAPNGVIAAYVNGWIDPLIRLVIWDRLERLRLIADKD